jgi:hypothetical protein
MSDQKRTPTAPSVPSSSNTDLLTKMKELEARLTSIEGRREEEMIYFASYTGYLKAYVERYANVANRKDLMQTGITDSRKFAQMAVQNYRDGLSQDVSEE